jgi:hypothetical protein
MHQDKNKIRMHHDTPKKLKRAHKKTLTINLLLINSVSVIFLSLIFPVK